MREAEPRAASPPDGAEGGDTEEVPMSKQRGACGFVRPEEGVVCEEDARDAGDVEAGEGMPHVKEPVDDRPDVRAREESMGDILRHM